MKRSQLLPLTACLLLAPPTAEAGSGFAITTDVAVDTRAKVALTIAAQHGTVTGAGDYTPGSTATLTATAAPGYAFTSWSGAATGTVNPVNVVMDSPKSVTANFAPDLMDGDTDGLSAYLEAVVYGTNPALADTDADGLTDGAEVNTTHSSPVLEDSDADGLSDGAEVNTHGSSPLLTDTDADGLSDRTEVEIHHSNPALKDSDGDGFDDLFEVNTGFNPASATSTPDAASSIRTAVEFRFNAADGVSYRIEGSTDLENWATVETDITGAGGVVTRFYSTEGIPKRYFRVRRN